MSDFLQSPEPDYAISDHALDQYISRGGEATLAEELKLASPVGSQWKKGFLLLLPSGLVAAGEIDGGRHVIATVLTKEFAMVNMQMRGVRISTPVSNPTNVKESRAELQRIDARERMERRMAKEKEDSITKVDIVNLAVRHAINSTKKAARKRDLLRVGIRSIDGDAAERYRFAFAAAKLAFDSIHSYFKRLTVERTDAHSLDAVSEHVSQFYRNFDSLCIKGWNGSAEADGTESMPGNSVGVNWGDGPDED